MVFSIDGHCVFIVVSFLLSLFISGKKNKNKNKKTAEIVLVARIFRLDHHWTNKSGYLEKSTALKLAKI